MVGKTACPVDRDISVGFYEVSRLVVVSNEWIRGGTFLRVCGFWTEWRPVCMVITYSKGKNQPGKVANPARGQLNRENEYSLSLFTPHNLVLWDGFGSPVPRQPAHLHTQAESGAYLRDSSRFPRRRPFIHLDRHAPSGQSRVYRVTQLRTDGIHCRESAGTGPVNLKVVPNGCCLGRSPWTN